MRATKHQPQFAWVRKSQDGGKQPCHDVKPLCTDIVSRSYAEGDQLGNESTVLEFKEKYNIPAHATYLKTMCGFMNHQGGHLVFGVADSGVVKGMTISRKDLDRLKLWVDNVHQQFIFDDGVPIPVNGTITVTEKPVGRKKYVMIIRCLPVGNGVKQVQLLNGEVWFRASASNQMVNRNTRWISYYDVRRKVSALQIKHHTALCNVRKELEEQQHKAEELAVHVVDIERILYELRKTEQTMVVKKLDYHIFAMPLLFMVGIVVMTSYFNLFTQI